MAQVIKRENITISTGEYQKDGQTKQRYRTIGELVTYQNDDGTVFSLGVFLQDPGCLQTVYSPWHHDIHKYQVRFFDLHNLQGLFCA